MYLLSVSIIFLEITSQIKINPLEPAAAILVPSGLNTKQYNLSIHKLQIKSLLAKGLREKSK